MLDNPDRLHSSEYQAYAILTTCRTLYTLQHGTIASKLVSARWAQERLGEDWAGLIEKGLTWLPGVEMESFDETMGFIRYTVEHSRDLS